jgi:Domain of unknown function (DUF4389)
MSEPGAAHSYPVPVRPPFPFERLLFALLFAVVAWFVFWSAIVLGVAQFVIYAANGRVNEELKEFTLRLVRYLGELLAFIVFVRDERPFPFAPFPKQA